jgi:hypothetical protein
MSEIIHFELHGEHKNMTSCNVYTEVNICKTFSELKNGHLFQKLYSLHSKLNSVSESALHAFLEILLIIHKFIQLCSIIMFPIFWSLPPLATHNVEKIDEF